MTLRWWRAVTHLGDAATTIGAALLVMALGEARLGMTMLLANTTSHLSVQILKRLVARPRPCDGSGRPLALVALPDPFSFPSGHAAAVFAIATPVALAHPSLVPVVMPPAVVVAWSRYRLRVHHPGDVLAGVALGLGGALLAYALL
ncbi:MAG TPA: phosphatase PAP2 family protein [Gemmatimonadales bacterium]|nr:phosphatase PAP2 family protein [Gemmatimonadales bacterium]